MKKVAAFLLNSVMLLFLSVLVMGLAVFVSSYLDIIFEPKVMLGFLSLAILVGLAVSVWLCVFFPAHYKKFPGTAVIESFSQGAASLRPAVVYFVIITAMIGLYFTCWKVNNVVFGRYVAEQEKRLETTGMMSADWKSYYPDMDYNDTDNAALYFKKALSRLEKSNIDDEVGRIWASAVGEEKPDFKSIDIEVDKALAGVADAARDMEEGLGHGKVLWIDVRNMEHKEFYSQDVPKVKFLFAYFRLRLLKAVVLFQQGDGDKAEKHLRAVTRCITLGTQDPSLAGAFVRLGLIRDVYAAVVVMARHAKDKDAVLRMAGSVTGDIGDIRMVVANGAALEMSGLSAMLKAWASGEISGCTLCLAGDGFGRRVLGHAHAVYFRFFGLWDTYVFLRQAELEIKIAGERNAENREELRWESEKLLREQVSITNIMTVVITPLYGAHIGRELRAEAARDTALMFAAAVAYKAKHGRYPDALDKLTPAYLKEIPKNPFTGKPYEYVTKGDYMEIITLDDEGKSVGSPAYMGKRPEKKVDGGKVTKK